MLFSIASISQRTEKGTYIFNERLGLLQCRIVSTSLHLGPTLNIVALSSYLLWWHRNILRKHGHTGRYFNTSRKWFTLTRSLVVETRRRVDRLRDPINHDVCEQFILGKNALDITMTIAPGTKHLNHPTRQTYRRIIQAIRKRLRTRVMHMGIGSSLFTEIF